MKKTNFLIWILLLMCVPWANLFAVSDAAVLFLLISPSPISNGMGQTFIALPKSDPYSTLYNPGNLGLSAIENYFSIGFYPEKVKWLPSIADDIFYDSKAINAGFRLTTNIYVGIGYHIVYLDLGEQLLTGEEGPEPIGSFQSWEKARGLSIGLGGDFGVKIGLGTTGKFIESHLGLLKSGSEYEEAKAEAYAWDFGGIVEIPLFKLLNDPLHFTFEGHQLHPFLNPALGYSLNNYGNEITYHLEEQADPLPRSARVGFRMNAGIMLSDENLIWKIVAFNWGRNAEDLLIKERKPPDFKVEYQGLMGDINFVNDLICWKPNEKIVKMQGWQLNCLETFYYRKGSYDDPDGKVQYKTTGYGFGLAGLLNLGRIVFPENNTIKFIAEHIDIQYHWSEMEIEVEHPLHGTQFKGINLVIK